MKYILIMSNDVKNKSVGLIYEALKKDIQSNLGENYKVIIADINKLSLSDNQLCISSSDGFFNSQSSIPISDIELVIKRNCAPNGKKALSICHELENRGSSVLNGCEFIEWSHSKIKQHQSLEQLDVLPKTIHFPAPVIFSEETWNTIKTQMEFPCIFKADKGTRAEGVFLVESLDGLKALIDDLSLLDTSKNNAFSGFILQKLINTSSQKDISSYYRINLVNGKPQSAVQFQLQWKSVKQGLYQKLVDFDKAENKPVSIEEFSDWAELKEILSACPSNHVVGIDVVREHHSKKLYLLECNDVPNISLTVELGEQYIKENQTAAMDCINFPQAIATLCINKIQNKATASPKAYESAANSQDHDLKKIYETLVC